MQARLEKRRLCDVESEVLETTHALAGMWVAQKWRLPPVITDTIGNQYRFASYRGNFRPIVAVVALASELSRRAGFGDAADFNESALDENALDFLELTPERLQEIEAELKECSSEARTFLESLEQV